MKKKSALLLLTGWMALASLTGCSQNENTSTTGSVTKKEVVYDGTTTIKTQYGSWTPPKGSRRLKDGNIVDADGTVIGNDGTFVYRGGGVG